MESELETRVNIPVVFVNRHDLYAIVVVLGIAILSCACVLGYSFSNFTQLKRNAEEVRNYIASRANSADQLGGSKQSARSFRMNDGRTDAVKAPFPGSRGG